MRSNLLKYSCVFFCSIGYALLSFAVPQFNILILGAEVLFFIANSITFDYLNLLSKNFGGHPSAVIIVLILIASIVINATLGGFLGLLIYKFMLRKTPTPDEHKK